LVVMGLLAPRLAALPLEPFLLVLALVALAEARRLDLFDRSSFSVAVVPLLMGGMLLGPAGAAFAGAASQLIRGVQRGSRWYKVAFNTSVQVLACAAAATAFDAFGAPLRTDALPLLVAATAAAGAVYFVHTFVVALAMATELESSPARVWA